MLHAFEGPDELASIAALNATPPAAAAAAQLGEAPPPAFPWAFELDELPQWQSRAREETAEATDGGGADPVEVLTMVVGRTTLGRVTVAEGDGALDLEYGGATIARATRCDEAMSIRIDFADGDARGECSSFTLGGVAPSPSFGQDAATTYAASSRQTTLLSHRTPLVRHHHWLRGGASCEARATRNTLPPSLVGVPIALARTRTKPSPPGGTSLVGAAPAPVVVLRPSLRDGSGRARASVCHAGSVMPRPGPRPGAVRVGLRSVSSGSDRPRFDPFFFFELRSFFVNATMYTNARNFLRERRATDRGSPI
jgi:hypothetical protein